MALRFIFVYVIVPIFLATGQSPKYELKGQEVKLRADITGRPDTILWKHDGNKVVEFNGNQERVFDPFQDRITLDWHSAQLTIADLRFEDSGEYELEVFVNKEFLRSRSQLKVIEKVAMPTISCEMNDGTGDNKSATLDCSVVPRPQSVDLDYIWISGGNVQLGPKLNIKLGDTFDDEEYSCNVSNPLSAETATFNAKGCYAVQSSSVALTASLVPIFGVVLVVLVFVVFCKLRRRACFAEERRGDLEQATQGSDETAHQANESTTLLDRAPTLPSTQRLGQLGYPDNVAVSGWENSTDEHETRDSPPSTPADESESPSGLDHDSNNNKGAAAGDQLCIPDVEARSKVSNTVAVTANLSEGKTSDLESFTALKNPESEEDADEDGDGNMPTANGVPPTAQPHSPPSLNSPNVTPKDSDGEPDQDSDLHQMNGEAKTSFGESDSSGTGKTNDSDNSSEDEQSAPIPEQKGSEASPHERESKALQDEAHAYEHDQHEMDGPASAAENKADSVGHDEELEESDLYLATDEQPQSLTPTKLDNTDINTSQDFADVTRERESKALQDEAHAYEDDQHETDRPTSAAESKADSVGHDEELEESDLYLATDEQPQSPTPTKPDNTDTNASQDFADVTRFDSDQEEEDKTGSDSDEDDGESADGKNKFLRDPKEEKPGQ